jgi:hypothetical protein
MNERTSSAVIKLPKIEPCRNPDHVQKVALFYSRYDTTGKIIGYQGNTVGYELFEVDLWESSYHHWFDDEPRKIFEKKGTDGKLAGLIIWEGVVAFEGEVRDGPPSLIGVPVLRRPTEEEIKALTFGTFDRLCCP